MCYNNILLHIQLLGSRKMSGVAALNETAAPVVWTKCSLKKENVPPPVLECYIENTRRLLENKIRKRHESFRDKIVRIPYYSLQSGYADGETPDRVIVYETTTNSQRTIVHGAKRNRNNNIATHIHLLV